VAVQATLENHPGRAVWLRNLAIHFRSRYNCTESLQDLEASPNAYLASGNITTTPILHRLEVAYSAGKILSFSPVKDLPKAYSLLRDAIHLLPLVTSRSLEREDQQHILGKLTGLTSLAASLSLEANESPLEALRFLELGRSVTNGQLLDYRSDISDLKDKHPTWADQFQPLREELDSPIPSEESTPMPFDQRLSVQHAAIHRRNKVAQDLENILLKIRQQPGFESFLRAESEEYLLSAAHQGPIVVLNVSKLRSDPILVAKGKVESIPLPHLCHCSMVKFTNTRTDDNKVMRGMLQWLWAGAVQPVLQQLGLHPGHKRGEPAVDSLPRIWWIGVGLMAKAPIHAAAKFRKGRVHMTTFHYCLPSYTSTIRALQYSRSRRVQLQNPAMVIVTMPTTPGQSSLGGVSEEADGIKAGISRRVNILTRPSAELVLQVLPDYGIAHFAYHGVSEINPADSHLLLVKEHLLAEEVDKLRVKDIAALKLPAAKLAYLSACSTAESPSSKLADD